MRRYGMRRMIDPSRFVEDVATNPMFPKELEQKSDAEAVKDWEGEGGASNHSGGSVVSRDLSVVPGNEVKEEAQCT